MKYPKKLQIGDTIGLVCPSSAVSFPRVEQCKNVLESLGYKVKAAENLTADYGGFTAGSGLTRAKWVNGMFADPEIDAIFCVRGGDGAGQAMGHLDFDLIRSHPKIFVGYSDITLYHLALNQLCDLVTFHGPMVSSNMVDHFDIETKESFFQALNADAPYEFQNTKGEPPETLKEGTATGTLVGGNLSLLSGSMGTPYEVNTKGKILFMEDVEEDMKRLDRFLYQLRNAGKFRDCAGILIGQFTDCTNEGNQKFTELDEFRDVLDGIHIPVMHHVQSGHSYPMMTLPLGATCTMDTATHTISFAAPER